MNTQLQTMNLALPIGSLQAYIRWTNQVPILTATEEYELAKKFTVEKDLEAAKKLILAHLRFVVRVSKNYLGYGLPQADLIQEGNIGLMKAVKRFNPEMGVRLVTFAFHWIKAEIHEFILRNWRIVKIATTKAQRKLFFNSRKLSSRLGWLSNSEVHDIAKDLNVSEQDVRTMEMRLSNHDEVIEPLPTAEDQDATPLILEDHRYRPDVLVEQKDYNTSREELLKNALNGLDSRSLDIIQQRWLTEQKVTLQDLAKKYNISIERIRQLEQQAMIKLKNIIAAN